MRNLVKSLDIVSGVCDIERVAGNDPANPKGPAMNATNETASRFYVEKVGADHHAWEVISRTRCTITIRQMRPIGEPVHTEWCYEMPIHRYAVETDPTAPTIRVRATRDGFYCVTPGARSLMPTNLPFHRVDWSR